MRDALTMGPRDARGRVTPHTRPPTDDDADHMLVRTVGASRAGRGRARVRAGLRLRPRAGRVDARRRRAGTWPTPAAAARRSGCAPTWRSASRATACARGTCSTPGDRAYCALSWAERARQRREDVDEADATARATARYWRGWLGRARIPDHRFREPIQRSALAIKGLTYMPTGATVAALTTSLPETPGGERNWDYRYTWMRDSTFTLQALHWLNLDWEADEFMQFVADLEPNDDGGAADHVRHRRPARPDRVDARRPLRLRGRPPGADRQRRLRPAPERRLRRGARLDPAPHAPQRTAAPAALADRPVAGRVRDEGLARAGPGDLGGPGHAAALRLLEADVLGGARPRREARRDPRRPEHAGDVACDRRGDPRGHPRARRLRARRPAPALRDRRARRVGAAGGDLRLPARPTTSACARPWTRSPGS